VPASPCICWCRSPSRVWPIFAATSLLDPVNVTLTQAELGPGAMEVFTTMAERLLGEDAAVLARAQLATFRDPYH
jgi:hypothetical protein